MTRRAPGGQTSHQYSPHGQPANHCRAIVLTDGAATRKKIKKDYEKALRDLDNSRRQLDHFHQVDLPEFTRWLNAHFGALLTELRELSQKIALDEALVFQVESEVMWSGGSYARAFKRVMELRENPEPPPNRAGGKGETEGEHDPSGAPPNAGDFGGEEDPLENLFDQIFGAFGPGEAAGEKPDAWAGPGHDSAAPHRASARLKELYRKLVRQLHPDVQEEMTAQKTEWWHQAQAAYEAGDVEQLEVILTLCEIGHSGTTAHTSATLLQRITAQLKSSLRAIKRQLTERRRDLAWNFSRRPDREVLASRLRGTMTRDLEEMRRHWRRNQEMIAEWKAAAERIKPSRRRKRQPQDGEFPF